METIKKLLRPGAAEDDKTLYGQENTANATDSKHQNAALTGEGSHLSSSQGQPGLPGKHTSSVPDSTTQHAGGKDGLMSGAADSSTLGQSQSGGHGSHDPSPIVRDSIRHNEGLTGQGSHLSGATDSNATEQHQPTGLGHGSLDPGATRPIGGSGLGHGRHERSDPTNMDATALGGSSGLGGNHSKSTNTTQGPHSSDMMNKLDPRVDSDQSRSTRTSDQTGNYASTGTGSSAGVGMATLGHREHDYSTGNGRGNPAISQSTQSMTQGPHSSDMMNKIDPRVDSDNSKNTNSGAGYSSSTGGSHQTGAMGLRVLGPHQTAAANLLDPHINNDGRGHEDAIHHHEKYGGGAEEADNDHRDAGKKAAVAGAVGLGALGLASDNHQSRFTERGADGSAGGNTSLMPGSFPAESAHITEGDFQHGSQNVLTIPDRTRATNDPTSSVGEKDHHYGRDAALVGGAAGLGGAAYDGSKYSDNKTSEPTHNSSMLNRLDPRVSTGDSGTSHGTNPVDRSHGIMTGNTTSHHPSHTTTGTSDIDNVRSQEPHHGRDATLGAGLGAGAAGAAYGLGRQHESHPQGVSTTTTTTSTSTSTSGPHSSGMLNRADPRVDSDRSREQGKDHNYGRDATLVGGAGAAAVGASQLGDRDEKELRNAQKQHDKAVHDHEKYEKDRAHQQKQHDKALHDHDKHEKDRAHQQKEHDKAVLAAEKERHHREREHEKQLKDNEKRDVKDEKHEKHEKHEKEHKGLFSFLHRDKNKKYTQAEEDDFSRQERDYNSSASTNTIVGSAQIGGTSLGDKLHGTERNRGIIGSSGFPHGHGPDTSVNQHTGEPLIGSTVPSHQTTPYTGSGAHQTSQGGGSLVGSSQIGGTSLGDTLHGTERNRGVVGSSGFPHGHGSDTSGNQHAGTHQTTHGGNTVTDDGLTHSHSRSGALGEGKQSVDEYNSSRGKQGDILSPTTQSYTRSGTGSSATHQSSHGQSAGGAAPKHLTGEQKADASGEGVLDSNSGVKTAQGVHAGESHGVGVATGSDGRNRLHKDPPAERF